VTIKTKVRYEGIYSSWVGVIIGEGRDMLGEYWAVKVTGTSSPFYPLGTIDHISKGTPWLTERSA